MNRALPASLALSLLAAAPLAGQAVTPVSALRPGQAVLFTLRNAVRAQEAYHLDNTRYAPHVTKLRFRAEPGVSVTVVSATQRGWIGKATYASMPGRSCVVYFGYPDPSVKIITDFEGQRPKREGEVACDSF